MGALLFLDTFFMKNFPKALAAKTQCELNIGRVLATFALLVLPALLLIIYQDGMAFIVAAPLIAAMGSPMIFAGGNIVYLFVWMLRKVCKPINGKEHLPQAHTFAEYLSEAQLVAEARRHAKLAMIALPVCLIPSCVYFYAAPVHESLQALNPEHQVKTIIIALLLGSLSLNVPAWASSIFILRKSKQ